MNMAPSPPPSFFSPDATDKLGKAIMFMVTTFLNDGLVQRADVVNLLEDIIQTIEKDPSRNTNDISGT